jgi:hypothetical protein
MKKAKFAGLNFGSAEVLLKEAQKNVNGGGFGYGSGNYWICFKKLPPYNCLSSESACNAQCPGGWGCSQVTNCQ